jgi:hypothetical protein
VGESKDVRGTHTRAGLFFALAFALSWLFWVPAAFLSRSTFPYPRGILFLLGGFGPSIAGVVMVYRARDQADRRDFWDRVLRFRRIDGVWYAFILATFPVLVALSVLVEVLAGNNVPFYPYLAALVAEPWLVVWMPVIALQVMLSAILLHFAYNFTFSFVYPIPETMHLYGTTLVLLMVIGVVVMWGPQTLTRRGVT